MRVPFTSLSILNTCLCGCLSFESDGQGHEEGCCQEGCCHEGEGDEGEGASSGCCEEACDEGSQEGSQEGLSEPSRTPLEDPTAFHCSGVALPDRSGGPGFLPPPFLDRATSPAIVRLKFVLL